MPRATLFGVVLALCALGCGDDVPATFVMVEIDAEPGVRASAVGLRIVVNGSSAASDSPDYAERFSQTFTHAANDLVWPRRMTVEPLDHDASRLFEVVATALDANGDDVAIVRARTGFVARSGRTLRLVFDDGCIAKQCGPDQTCRAGDCDNAQIDPDDLDNFDPRSPTDGGIDASGSDGAGTGGSGGTSGSGGNGGTGGDAGNGGMAGAGGNGGSAGSAGIADASIDAGSDAGPIDGFSYTPSNFDPVGITHSAEVTLSCGVTTFDSQTRMFTNWCSGQPMPSIAVRPQSDGSSVIVLGFASLTIPMSNTLKLVGDKPVILAVFGDATIDGSLSADAVADVSGPGGDACVALTGAGGGFGSVGGASMTQAGGAVRGSSSPVPLIAGCRGGPSMITRGGGAGGALQLSVAGRLILSGTVSAVGGGGRAPQMSMQGTGGGGGSGGAILIEANVLTLDAVSWISTNGGGGGSGLTFVGMGIAGGDGHKNSTTGGVGGSSSLTTNFGGRGAGAATQAGDGTMTGGGGGGVGRIHIRGETSCNANGNVSPAFTRGGSC